MADIRSYRDLLVWQKAMDLAEKTYYSIRTFPKEETYGLTSQIRRASVSIPSNIAEGQARNTTGEFLNFLGIARGSLAELETQLVLAQRIGYLSLEQFKALLDDCCETGRLLNGIMRSLPTDH